MPCGSVRLLYVMFGAVNVGVARPWPSEPWQVAQPARIILPPIMPPPPIMPSLPVRGIAFPLASTPDRKMTSPREAAERLAEPCEPSTRTPTAASAATASATATITRFVRREPAMLEVAELLQVLLTVDLAGGVAALEDVPRRLRSACPRRRGRSC